MNDSHALKKADIGKILLLYVFDSHALKKADIGKILLLNV